MATNIISVSIPMELAKFLEENEDISPSKIIQTRLFEIKNDQDRTGNRLKALTTRNMNLRQDLDDFINYAREKGVFIKDMPLNKSELLE